MSEKISSSWTHHLRFYAFLMTGINTFLAFEGAVSRQKISYFNDYSQELALSLLYFLVFGRKHRQK